MSGEIPHLSINVHVVEDIFNSKSLKIANNKKN